MTTNCFNLENIDIAWCPGCGDFNILKILKESLFELGLKPEETVMVSGIGQAAKLPHYINANVFNGLHGRALPAATGIKASNPELNVIVTSGDGDIYGEGGNHFIHAIRRNPNIVTIIHNNMIYGLTKGQASPTSNKGFITKVQTEGVTLEPFNPIAVAVSLDASFVARASAGDSEQTKEIIKRAIEHKGFSIIDVFQPCVTFNKVNTFKWFKDNTYYLDESHNPYDKVEAYKKALETDKYPLGIFYINDKKLTFEETICVYKENNKPLYMREVNKKNKVHAYMKKFI